MLFVALTFAAYILFELLKQLPIHPIQYRFVGIAHARFFLLLVSLSEHMRFVYAYLIAPCKIDRYQLPRSLLETLYRNKKGGMKNHAAFCIPGFAGSL